MEMSLFCSEAQAPVKYSVELIKIANFIEFIYSNNKALLCLSCLMHINVDLGGKGRDFTASDSRVAKFRNNCISYD